MGHPVVWFEEGKDGKALRDFYQKLFGWKICPLLCLFMSLKSSLTRSNGP